MIIDNRALFKWQLLYFTCLWLCIRSEISDRWDDGEAGVEDGEFLCVIGIWLCSGYIQQLMYAL